MEALACNITKIIEYVEQLTGVKVNQVRSLGGGSLDVYKRQMLRDDWSSLGL